MGSFDSFYFAKGTLPDNKANEDEEFQTKCLGCDLDKYFVDREGNVKRFDLDGTEVEDSINNEVLVYSYDFSKEKNVKFQEYKIIILNNKIAYIEKISERGYQNE